MNRQLSTHMRNYCQKRTLLTIILAMCISPNINADDKNFAFLDLMGVDVDADVRPPIEAASEPPQVSTFSPDGELSGNRESSPPPNDVLEGEFQPLTTFAKRVVGTNTDNQVLGKDLILHRQLDTGLYPSYLISYGDTNNVDKTNSTVTTVTGDNYFNFVPGLLYAIDFAPHGIKLAYQGSIVKYSDNTDLDKNDHTYSITSDMNFGSNLQYGLSVSANRNDSREPRGSSIARALDPSLPEDSYTQDTYTMSIRLGEKAKSSRVGGLLATVGTSASNLRYRNNDQGGDRDSDSDSINLGIQYKLTDHVTLTGGTEQTKSDYLSSSNNNDSTTTNSGIGINFSYRGLSISHRFAAVEQDFDDPDLTDFKTDNISDSYNLTLGYALTDKVRLSLIATRNQEDSSDVASSFRIASLLSFGINYRLSDRISVALQRGTLEDDFNAGRLDETKSLSFSGNYRFSNALKLGVSYTDTNKGSNNTAIPYDDQTIVLTLTGEFRK